MNSTAAIAEEPLEFWENEFDLLQKCWPLNGTDQSTSFLCIANKVFAYLSAFVVPVISLLGAFGNALSCYIFVCAFKHHTRHNIFLAFLCFADTLNLLFAPFIWYLPAKGLPFLTNGRVYYFIHHTEAGCIAWRFFWVFLRKSTVNMFLLTSLDRCISLLFPLKMMLVTPRMSVYISLLVYLFSVVLCAVFIVDLGYIKFFGKLHCFKRNREAWAFYTMYITHGEILSSATILIINLVLLCKLVHILRLRRTLRCGATPANNSRAEKELISGGVLLLCLALIYLLCVIPRAAVIYLTYNVAYLPYSVSETVGFLYFLQEASNVLVFLYRVGGFGAAARRLLCPC